MTGLIGVGRGLIQRILACVPVLLRLVFVSPFPFAFQVDGIFSLGIIDLMQHLAVFLAELNLKIPLLHIRLLLLDLLNPLRERRLYNTFMTVNGPDHGCTFDKAAFGNYSIG
jgi:hypothetical protein